MGEGIEDVINRWVAGRKSALVLEISQGKTMVAAASLQFDLTPPEIEGWVENGRGGLENTLRAKPEDVRERYERQLKYLQRAYDEAMLEIRAPESWHPGWERVGADALAPASTDLTLRIFVRADGVDQRQQLDGIPRS
jgi:hypothetical protein